MLVVTWFCLARSQERDGGTGHMLAYENRDLFFYSSCGLIRACVSLRWFFDPLEKRRH